MSSLLQYAISANAFILAQLSAEQLAKVKKVILFGSVAQGTATKDSDIDLFYDIEATKKEILKIKKSINKAREEFYRSNIGLGFRLRGISNPLAPIAGRLDEWLDLKKTIAKGSIMLYGPYLEKVRGEPALLIWWERLHPKSRGAFLNMVYGFKVGPKQYRGLLQKLDGKKAGKSAIIIPVRNKAWIEKVLQKYDVSYKVIEISLV